MWKRVNFAEGFGAGAGLMILLAGVSILVRSLLPGAGLNRAPETRNPSSLQASAGAETAPPLPADYPDRCRTAGL